MLVGSKNYQSIWLDEIDPTVVKVIDQQRLPFFFEIKELRSADDVFNSIKDMTVRGAPLIGAAAAFGIYFASLETTSTTDLKVHLENAARYLISCRPTAVNLSGSVNYVLNRIKAHAGNRSLSETALSAALEICETEKENCRKIGINGLPVIESVSKKKNGEPVNILTHCNAGWLACIDYGTVTAPIYLAHNSGIPVHVWVDETRPMNQGARLTAWELGEAGIPHTLITDNTGGHLMQRGMVDLVIVGSDRTSRNGDVANKIGTYLKALAARDNNIPFYCALPSSSIDMELADGLNEIPIEERDVSEVTHVPGLLAGKIEYVRICPEKTTAVNYGFDVTPARYVSGLITERGICKASEKDIRNMFSDKFN